jgi:ubiquinone biosynthesis monooxygenase Coq7
LNLKTALGYGSAMSQRHYTAADRLMLHADTALRTLFGHPQTTERANPANGIDEAQLDEQQQRHVAGLMRVNHAGEVAAQGLYEGQALTARLPDVREKMHRAAAEENDHLDWCEQRIEELGQHKSLLNPLWYIGSLTIGALAGKAGDRWSLGFVAETERQVVKHLDEHLEQLPHQDQRSRAILNQMREDEQQHATAALEAGGAELPHGIKRLMGLTSKIMTKTAYYL